MGWAGNGTDSASHLHYEGRGSVTAADLLIPSCP
jgi:hypothetical protein